MWNAVQVATWLRWSQKKLNIAALSLDLFPDNGFSLCSWSVEDFIRAAGTHDGPLLAAALFWLKRPYIPTGNFLKIFQDHSGSFRIVQYLPSSL